MFSKIIFFFFLITINKITSENLFDLVLNFTEIEIHIPESTINCINQKVANLKNKKSDIKVESSSSAIQEIYENAEILCSENFETNIESSFDEIVNGLEGKKQNDNEVQDCLKFLLIKRNATGPLVETIKKNSLESFKNDKNCEEIEKKLTANEVGDRECIEKSPLFNGNIKANLMSIAYYDREIVEAEKIIYVEETKFHLEFHMNCLIEKENLK
ncbi:hypothetical protein PVAND_017236 [Polypedilum vanderplanki]|uniref:Uncharacterized protein n=1 Tax=Polypedilum vanderplanki TaxID=319348 RepID=A0A9J6BHP0_POLVA|nr:hypothetical protein PVAND_017236 [Polypedilum vanderplanki]